MNKRLPWATFSIIIANLVVAYFALNNPDFALRWGFTPKPLANPGVAERAITLFTSMFVHVSPLHLLANMLFIAAVGPPAERAAGSLKFAIIFFAAGIAGVLVHWFLAPVSMPAIAGEPLVGASAPVAGLVGYSLVRFYRVKVPLLPKLWVPVFVVILFWIALQVAAGFVAVSQFGAQTGYWAHVGGFVAGLSLALLFRASSEAAEEAWHDHLREADMRSAAAGAAAAKKGAQRADALKKAFEHAESLGNDEEADNALLHLLETDPNYDDGFAAVKLAERKILSRLPASARIRIASAMQNESAAEVLLLSILEEEPGAETPNTLLALIEMFAQTDKHAARVHYERLMREYALSPQAETASRKWGGAF